MKKKLLLSGLFVLLALWVATGLSPFQLLISFIAAGALPGVRFTISPYLMFALALAGGVAMLMMLQNFDGPLLGFAKEAEVQEVKLKSTKKTKAQTHKRRTSKTSTKKRRNQQRRRFTQLAASTKQ